MALISGTVGVIGSAIANSIAGVWSSATKGLSRTSKRFRKFEYSYAKRMYPKGTTKAQAKKIEARRREKTKKTTKGIYGSVKKIGQDASKVMMKMDVVNPIEITKSIMDSMYRVTLALLAIAGVAGMIYIVQVEVSGGEPLFTNTLGSIGELMGKIGYFWIAIVLLAYDFTRRWSRGAGV